MAGTSAGDASPSGLTQRFPKFADSQSVYEALRDHGWIEGKNLIIDYRYFEGHVERIPTLSTELVALKPDLLIGSGPQAAAALKSATATIPIVFVAVADPVGLGLVQSLPRPGGNATGLRPWYLRISSRNA
jgi:putative ABC transport system substrate-binding protein